MFRKLSETICHLAQEASALRLQREIEFDWLKSHAGLATKCDLERMEGRLMANNAELAADLKLVLAQQQKTAGEIKDVQTGVDTLKTKVTELEAIIAAGGEPSQELVDAVAAVKAQAQIVDDLIPDLPTPPPVA